VRRDQRHLPDVHGQRLEGDDLDVKAPVVLSGNKQLDDGTKMRVAENDADSNAKDAK